MLVPKVGVNFDAPVVMRYRYRVPHPYCVMLYYDSLPDPSVEDICAIWVQPLSADRVRAHNYMGVVDDTSTDNEIKSYQLLIFAQDKPILENQHPKLLPLDPGPRPPSGRPVGHRLPALAGRLGRHLRRGARPG